MGCERCRGRVLALREEARALSALLRTSGRRAAAAAVRCRSGPRLAYGLPVAVGATALATAVAPRYRDRFPRMGWLRPSALLGVNEMLFDTIFMLRDRAPGWLELATALGALAGLAAILTFLAGALLRRQAGRSLRRCSGSRSPAAAPKQRARPPASSIGDTVRVERGEIHQGTLAVSCESLEIDGLVIGDVLAFCERVAIRGEVEGT